MGLCGEGKYSSISPSLTVDGKNNRHIPRIKRAVAVSALFIPFNVFKIVLQVYCLSIFFLVIDKKEVPESRWESVFC